METLLSSFLGEDISYWLALALSVCGFCSIVATRTPNRVDDKILQVIMDIINFAGANMGKAKNAE
jgi:hypothetical protein